MSTSCNCCQMMPALEKEVLAWERKYRALTAVDDLREKVKRLNNELAWALVAEKEKVGVVRNRIYDIIYSFSF